MENVVIVALVLVGASAGERGGGAGRVGADSGHGRGGRGVGVALVTVQGLAVDEGEAGNVEAGAGSAGIHEGVGAVLFDGSNELGGHALILLGFLDGPGATDGGNVLLELLLLFELLVVGPHEITGPANSAVEDVTLVGSLVLLLAWQPRSGQATGTTTDRARHHVATRRAHAGAAETGRKSRVVGQMLADLLVIEPVLRNEVRQFLDALVDVVTTPALNHVV